MAEASFVSMYTREFVALAVRPQDSVGLDDTLARKIGEARSHSALMDARKGGEHLEAIAVSLETQAALPVARAHKALSDEAWALRAEFLSRTAALLRDPTGPAIRRVNRLALRTPFDVPAEA